MSTKPARRWSADSMNDLPRSMRSHVLRGMSPEDILQWQNDWYRWARDAQLPPEGDWRIWLFLGGRGAGKTRAGAEWIANGVQRGTMRRVGIVGATFADARSVMIEGVSGLLAVSRGADFEPSNRRVLWANGAVGDVLTAEEPDIIRGHQCDAIWADEFAKWSEPQQALDMLLMSLRLGKDPRMMVTTTPRAITPLLDLMTMPGTATTKATTWDNARYLAPSFVAGLRQRYAGTRLGRQELDAELIEDNDAALWRRDWIEKTRVREAPPLVRVVIAVDPPASATGGECGIVAAGVAGNGHAYVLGDCSVGGATPDGWARRVADAYEDHRADSIVAEANQGGDMVEALLRGPAPNASVKLVHATRDKRTRASPAAALYEQGRVHHLGAFPELEDQLCHYDGEGKSPDRMDALVWALTELFPRTRRALPRVRVL
ncbi:MAG: DNA-packaging protein [Alphaproteobacteria bacterium]|nr:terminase family protein [Alphaproteobacteria bacterium]MDE2112947.1 DNA-packaging protein [Alphaproteobacteria bacterium]MDE2495921.1 DNA-packaging protein [Alphaproteobacteria bacterium]